MEILTVRITKKWLRIAKFTMRDHIEKIINMPHNDLIEMCLSKYGIRIIAQNRDELLTQCLLWALEDAIPYDMVN